MPEKIYVSADRGPVLRASAGMNAVSEVSYNNELNSSAAPQTGRHAGQGGKVRRSAFGCHRQ